MNRTDGSYLDRMSVQFAKHQEPWLLTAICDRHSKSNISLGVDVYRPCTQLLPDDGLHLLCDFTKIFMETAVKADLESDYFCLLIFRKTRAKKCALNLLQPTGHVMHQQFNIQQLYFLPQRIYVFCVYLRTNSDLCHLQLKLIGFYNRDEKCLLRGTNWVFNKAVCVSSLNF